MDPLTVAAAKGCSSVAGNLAAAKVKKWFEYVNDYEKNLKKLKQLHELLVSKEKDIQALVETGERGGEEVTAQVNTWLDWAEDLLRKVTDVHDRELFMDEETRKATEKCCFQLVGWNPKFRYDMSLKAKEMTDLIEEKIYELDGIRNLTISTGPPSIAGATDQGDFCQLLESRLREVEKIMEALKSNNINRIGIHGMGGAGKTVLAYEVARRAEQAKLFNAVVVVEITHTPNIKQIQDRIAERIGFPLDGIRTIEERELRLYNRFKDIGRPTRKSKNDIQEAHALAEISPTLKENASNDGLRGRSEECGKLLIILDNIWSRQDLRHFGIGYDLATDYKCKVVMTSRQEDVCKQMGATHPNIYTVGDLDPNEAELLFREKVGDTLKQSPMYEEIMKKLLSKCSRLPLSINILGNALKNQDIDFWKSMDRKLNKCGQGEDIGVLSEIYSIIKMSYNSINNNQKKRLFLLCCLFPPGSNIQIINLLRYGIGLGLFQNMNSLSDALEEVQNWVDELQSLSLLLEIDAQKEKIKIHDDVREAGQFIATRDKGNNFGFHVGSMPGWMGKKSGNQYSAITMVSDENYICLPDLHLPNLQLLRLEGASNLCDNYFSRMQKIKVLDMAKSDVKKFPSSIKQLSSLQTLLLDGCMLDDISWICKLTMLQVLSLKENNIKKLPLEVGNLVSLKLLDLTKCEKLLYIPAGVLGKLTKLEGLYMMDSFDDWAVEGCNVSTASISELKNCSSLQVLEIKVRSTKQLVNRDFPFDNHAALSRFHIDMGYFSRSTLVKNVELHRYMRVHNLTAGDVVNEGWKSMMRKVEYLALSNLNGLSWCTEGKSYRRPLYKSIPDYFFRELKSLILSSVSGIEYALPAVDCGKTLKLIQVCECNDMKYVVCGTVTLDEIEYPCLETLRLENLPSMVGLYEEDTSTSGNAEKGKSVETVLFKEKARFPSLETLHLDSINSIEQLWGMKSGQDFSTSFSKLKEIHVKSMPKLKYVWSEQMMGKGRSTKLDGDNPMGSSTVSTSDVINGLQWLTSLRISDCNAMKQIISSKAAVVASDELEDLMGTAVCFLKLSSLQLSNLGNLVCFYDGAQNIEFPALGDLQLKGLHSFETFVKPYDQHLIYGTAVANDDGDIVSDHIEYNNHDRVNTLFISAKAIFASVKTMELELLDNVEILWDTKQLDPAFPKLKILKLRSIPMLKCVWDKGSDCTSSPNIEELDIHDCGSIQSMCPPSTANELNRLERLSITGCSKLKQVISTEEEGEYNSKVVPDTIIRLSKLSSLTLENLKSFTCFYQGSLNIEFQALEEMTLEELGKFITFAKPFRQYWSDEPAGGYYVDDVDGSWAEDSLFFLDKVLLPSLKKLYVENVDNIETIWDIGDSEDLAMKLPKLETLSLSRLPKLRAVWSGAKIDNLNGISKALKILHLGSLPIIQVLVGKAAGSRSICDGTVYERPSTKVALFDGESEFPLLEELVILNMFNLEKLLDTMSGSHDQKEEDAIAASLPNLKKLGLGACPILKLEHFPYTVVNNLSNLSVIGFPQLRCIFSTITSYKLGGGFCIRSPFQLRNLEELTIIACGSVEELFQVDDGDHLNDTMLPNVKTLELSGLGKLRSVPYHMFPSLQDLDIAECRVGNEFLLSADTCMQKSGRNLALQKLVTLKIVDCDDLEAVIGPKGNLKVDDYHEQADVPIKGVIEFPKLEAITLSGLTSLCTFSSSHHDVLLPSLKSLEIAGCYNIRSLSLSGNVMASKLSTADVEGDVTEVNEDMNTIIAHTIQKKYKSVRHWPRTSQHHLHMSNDDRHELMLSKVEGLYTCDVCKQEGAEWLYICYGCHFKVHPNCVLDESILLQESEEAYHEVANAGSIHQRPLLPPKGWPGVAQHNLHAVRHPLKLTTGRYFQCDVCGKYITKASFSCLSCAFDAHPECVLEESQMSTKQEELPGVIQTPPSSGAIGGHPASASSERPFIYYPPTAYVNPYLYGATSASTTYVDEYGATSASTTYADEYESVVSSLAAMADQLFSFPPHYPC